MARQKKERPHPPSCIRTREGDGKFYCDLCNTGRWIGSWQEHVQGVAHQRMAAADNERSEHNAAVSSAYAGAEPVALDHLAVTQERLPPFEPGYSQPDTDMSSWNNDEPSMPMELAEAEAALNAGREETLEDYQARVRLHMEKLVTDLAFMHVDNGDQDDWELPDWQDGQFLFFTVWTQLIHAQARHRMRRKSRTSTSRFSDVKLLNGLHIQAKQCVACHRFMFILIPTAQADVIPGHPR